MIRFTAMVGAREHAAGATDNRSSLDPVRHCGFVKVAGGMDVDETDGLEHVFLRVAAPA